jgi:hypothetical protein
MVRPKDFDFSDPAIAFDAIFVVNLEREAYKFHRVSEMLATLGLGNHERWDAFDAQDPEAKVGMVSRIAMQMTGTGSGWSIEGIGCAESHLSLLRHIADLDLPRVLVLEDDVYFNPNVDRSAPPCRAPLTPCPALSFWLRPPTARNFSRQSRTSRMTLSLPLSGAACVSRLPRSDPSQPRLAVQLHRPRAACLKALTAHSRRTASTHPSPRPGGASRALESILTPSGSLAVLPSPNPRPCQHFRTQDRAAVRALSSWASLGTGACCTHAYVVSDVGASRLLDLLEGALGAPVDEVPHLVDPHHHRLFISFGVAAECPPSRAPTPTSDPSSFTKFQVIRDLCLSGQISCYVPDMGVKSHHQDFLAEGFFLQSVSKGQ